MKPIPLGSDAVWEKKGGSRRAEGNFWILNPREKHIYSGSSSQFLGRDPIGDILL